MTAGRKDTAHALRACALIASCSLLAQACGEQQPGRGGSARAKVRPAGPVIARVDGAPITRADLLAQLADGRSRRDALEACIAEQLLAGEARRRQLDRSPSVQQVLRRALAQQLIVDDFARRFHKRDIPEALVEHAYEANRIRYVHPEMREVSHIVVGVGAAAPAQQIRAARALAHELHTRATARPISADRFRALVETFRPRAKAAGLQIKAEHFNTPRRGFTVAAFADAAFDLEQPGDISPVVRTRYGFHVIYLQKRIPKRDAPLRAVQAEIREKIFDDARRQMFRKFVDDLLERHDARIDTDALRRATRGRS